MDVGDRLRHMDLKYEDAIDNSADALRSNENFNPQDRPDKRIGTIKFNNENVAW